MFRQTKTGALIVPQRAVTEMQGKYLVAVVAADNKVSLTGFITFQQVAKAATTARNPRTGEAVDVEDKKVPFFKTGKLLRDRLNGKA